MKPPLGAGSLAKGSVGLPRSMPAESTSCAVSPRTDQNRTSADGSRLNTSKWLTAAGSRVRALAAAGATPFRGDTDVERDHIVRTVTDADPRVAVHGEALADVIEQMGFSAYFKDPEDNLMGLWQSA